MAIRPTNTSTGLFRTWWRHKVSLAISLGVTAAALFIYYVTFLGERPMPLFDFLARQELSSLDTRFRLRGRAQPDPRIVIVDIDQRSQEVLGRWPFRRVHFAHMLDALREDGARTVVFDITFSKPDETAAPVRAIETRLQALSKNGQPISAAVRAELARLETEYSDDQQFAEAIRRFGKVVLGNYFLYTAADLQGVDSKSLDRYANLIAFFPYPQLRVEKPRDASQATPAAGVQARLNLIQDFDDLFLVPRGAQANTEDYTAALPADKAGTGFFNEFSDADGVVRRAQLALPYGRDADRKQWDFYASIDVQGLRLFLDLTNEQTVLNFADAGITSLEFGPNIIVHPDGVGRMMINYQGGARTFSYVSIADVANKTFPPGTFKDKLVLVGASATGIGDTRVTPFGGLDFPGVEIHANVIDNVLNQHFLKHGALQALADLALIFLFGVPLGVWLSVTQPRWMFLGLLLLAPFAALVYFAFLHGWWLNFIVPSLFTLVPNVALVSLYRVLVEDREKRRVRGAFQQYVSPEVIRRLLDNPERVQPRKTDVTVLFSDIRGFTSISEKLDAQELADLLNGYLTEMTRIIFRNQGTLDKYIGDAVMAIWGAPFDEPNHAERCCDAAIDMLARLADLRKQWKERGQPELDIGIGVNTGIASVGNMGSSLRYGYTALGDAVNLSSRLEGLNKEYGSRIIVSESTLAAIRKPGFVFRELDLIRVKGKLQPVTIHELLGRRNGAAGSSELDELADVFGRGREAYKRRDWSGALQWFQKTLERWPEDGPARIFLSRVLEYQFEAPARDWDGVYVMKHK